MASSRRTEFDLGSLDLALGDLAPDARVILAFSGGLDSHVLLHWLSESGRVDRRCLQAVHVQHNLQPQAEDWAGHCRRVCEALAVDFRLLSVDARAAPGESPEQAARNARYAALVDCLGSGDLLLTAHHRDDQAETVLLQLLRGGGMPGLAAMPARRAFGPAQLVRPLLGYSRAALERYACAHGLEWVCDPSNEDTGLDRNFVRHQLLPLVSKRWPAASASLSRAAGYCAEAEQLLEALARIDCGEDAVDVTGGLSTASLLALPDARRRNLLRQWLKWAGHPPPSAVVLARMIDEVALAAQGRQPVVAWAGTELRRHRARLYARAEPRSRTATFRAPISPGRGVRLPAGDRVFLHRQGGDIDPSRVEGARLEVSYRRGGERVRLRGDGPRRTLKNLFRESAVPPWVRDETPLLLHGERVVAVAGRWVDADFSLGDRAGTGMLFEWHHEAASGSL